MITNTEDIEKKVYDYYKNQIETNQVMIDNQVSFLWYTEIKEINSNQNYIVVDMIPFDTEQSCLGTDSGLHKREQGSLLISLFTKYKISDPKRRSIIEEVLNMTDNVDIDIRFGVCNRGKAENNEDIGMNQTPIICPYTSEIYKSK